MENKKEIVNILKELKNNNNYLSIEIDSFVDYNDNDYICDIITELSDNNIDIYTSDLLEWLKNNYDVVEEANEALGASNDIIKQCQQGQYYQYSNEMYENLSDYIKLYAYDYILNTLNIEEITEAQHEEIESELSIIDNNDKLEDIKSLIDNILDTEKGEKENEK